MDRSERVARLAIRTRANVVMRQVMRSLGLTSIVKPMLRLLGLRKSVEYEKPVREVVCLAMRPDDLVRDVGAYRGVYAALLSELVRPAGRLFAIEPEARNPETLEWAIWCFA